MVFLIMSSLTKAESATINGAKSRYPKMPQGRAAVSMNAFSHGFTAKTLIVQNENPDNPDRFNEMLKSYFDYPKPANQIEADLIADMVARWRPRCIWRFETATLDIEMDSQAPAFE